MLLNSHQQQLFIILYNLVHLSSIQHFPVPWFSWSVAVDPAEIVTAVAGGGGVVYGPDVSLPAATYSVKVGTGGAMEIQAGLQGRSGGDSVFGLHLQQLDNESTHFRAFGGGGGGSYPSPSYPGLGGGAGGGGGGENPGPKGDSPSGFTWRISTSTTIWNCY